MSKYRGFADMDPEKQKALASQGGKAAHKLKAAHTWNTEEAKEAGRKGGLAMWRRKRAKKAAGLAVLLLVFIGSAAHANPIVLTGGRIESETQATSLTGEGFSFVGSAIAGEGRLDPLVCLICVPGTRLSVGGDLTGSALMGVVSLAGATYETGGASDPTAFSLRFFGQAIVPPQHGRVATITVPFTMMGVVSSDVWEVALAGQGLATVWFLIQPLDETTTVWGVDRVRYDFSDSTHPVPEPSMLVLLATGMAGGWVRWRKTNG